MPPPKRRSPRRVRTPDGEARGAILRTAEEMLEQRSLQDLSVTEIAKASGVSRASFYFYFATKPALLASLAEAACEELLEIWREWWAADGPVDEAELRELFDATLGHWHRHRAVLTATVESWRHDPEVGAMWAGIIGRFTDRTAERIERSAGGTSEDIRALAAVLVWSVERCLYTALAGIEPAFEDRQRLADAMTLTWARVLRI